MYIKIISLFLVFFISFGSINFSYAENCKYKSQIESCKKMNENGHPLSEEDFLCISENNMEKMVYNLILDDKFKEIDKEADDYLFSSEKGKARFFGPEQEEPFLKGVDEIEKLFGKYGYFYNKYKAAIGGSEGKSLIEETVNCLGGETNTITASSFLFNSSSIENLILDKNNTRKQVAYDTMKVNKQQVRKDQKKKYNQEKRTHYDSVSKLFMVNIGYILRIIFKWASKTKNPL